MMTEKKQPHAIALFSGGLDSSLAVLLMLRQNIKVTALTFLNHFGCDITDHSSCGHDPYPVADKFGFTVKLVHLGEKFVDIVKSPTYGHGRNMNPCVDCRILMLKEAKDFMDLVGADFIITGEVLGQRPKSQRRNEMDIVVRDSHLKDILLRPLCAKLLKPTKPERDGLVDREQLEGISGRSRRRQRELAEIFGLEDYPNPAAGCLLTDRGYSIKLCDLLDHKEEVTFDDLNLLRIGRHFRISPTLKVIMGRNEEDNLKLEQYLDRFPGLMVTDFGSPLSLLVGQYDDETLRIVGGLTARYTHGRDLPSVMVQVKSGDDEKDLSVKPLSIGDVEQYRMVWRSHGRTTASRADR